MCIPLKGSPNGWLPGLLKMRAPSRRRSAVVPARISYLVANFVCPDETGVSGLAIASRFSLAATKTKGCEAADR